MWGLHDNPYHHHIDYYLKPFSLIRSPLQRNLVKSSSSSSSSSSFGCRAGDYKFLQSLRSYVSDFRSFLRPQQFLYVGSITCWFYFVCFFPSHQLQVQVNKKIEKKERKKKKKYNLSSAFCVGTKRVYFLHGSSSGLLRSVRYYCF